MMKKRVFILTILILLQIFGIIEISFGAEKSEVYFFINSPRGDLNGYKISIFDFRGLYINEITLDEGGRGRLLLEHGKYKFIISKDKRMLVKDNQLLKSSFENVTIDFPSVSLFERLFDENLRNILKGIAIAYSIFLVRATYFTLSVGKILIKRLNKNSELLVHVLETIRQENPLDSKQKTIFTDNLNKVLKELDENIKEIEEKYLGEFLRYSPWVGGKIVKIKEVKSNIEWHVAEKNIDDIRRELFYEAKGENLSNDVKKLSLLVSRKIMIFKMK